MDKTHLEGKPHGPVHRKTRKISPIHKELYTKGLITALVSKLEREADMRRKPRYGYYPGGFCILGKTESRDRETGGRLEATIGSWLRAMGGATGTGGVSSDRHSSQPATSRSKAYPSFPLFSSTFRPQSAVHPIKALLSGRHIHPRPVPTHVSAPRKSETGKSVIDVMIPAPKRGDTPEARKGHYKSRSLQQTDLGTVYTH